MSASATLLAADLGKTRLRLQAVTADGAVLAETTGAGLAGAASSSPDAIAAAVVAARDELGIDTQGLGLSLGVAGTLAAPERGRAIADALAQALRTPITVTSDLIAAHLGAFAGATGTVLIAGTGAVGLGLGPDGELLQSDGWGPELGDFGSGAWIGRAGIQAVLAARDGRGPASAALDAALNTLVPADQVIAWVHASENPAGTCGTFAPAVLAAAEAGDAVATAIAQEAAVHLATTAARASVHLDTPAPVAVLGGLTGHPWFAALLNEELSVADLHPVAPQHTALVGAVLLAEHHDLPHERHTHRA